MRLPEDMLANRRRAPRAIGVRGMFVLGLAVLAAPPMAARADQIEAQVNATTKTADGAEGIASQVEPGATSVNVVPVPVIDPTLGEGMALAGLYTFRATEDPDAPRSTIALGGGYTNTDSWVVGTGLKVYLAGDRYRAGIATGYGHLNLKYYGIGADSRFAAHPVDLTIDGLTTSATLQARVLENFYIGMKAKFLKSDLAVPLPIDVLPSLGLQADVFGVGGTVEYDSRDSTWWPTRGANATAEVLRYQKSILSRGDYVIVDSHASGFVSLAERLVLAGDIRVARAGTDAPFYLYPFISLRGFPAGQYLNGAVVQAQAEIRWMAWERLGFVAFAGAGIAAPDLDRLGDGAKAAAAGWGVRYQVSPIDRMNIGIDMATGGNDMAIYFKVGEAF